MNKKIILISIIGFIILGILFYQFLICKSGIECYTSPGFSVSEVCHENINELDCSSINMRIYGGPEFNNDTNQWCLDCRGSEPSSCFNRYPLCFFE